MIELDKPEPTRVTVTMGFTRNMGNFESLRIDVGVSSSARDGETADATFDRVYKFTEEKLEEKFNETEQALKEAGLGEQN